MDGGELAGTHDRQCSVCFGFLLNLPIALMGLGTFGPAGLLLAMFLTMLVAGLAASLTELLRMLVQRFG